jgi:hypothetical protein
MSNLKNAIEWHCLSCDEHGLGDYFEEHICADDMNRVEAVNG